jgi:octopine/nopaline transport system permease protein
MDLLAFGDSGWGDEMLLATLMTLVISVSAFALGLVLGAIGATMKRSRFVPVRWLAEGYTVVGRGVPELLIIYLLFFGSSGAVMFVARMFGYGGYIEVNAFVVGVTAIGLVQGAYQTEVFRGAVDAVPKGQIEAARAAGMDDFLLFRRVLMPQVLRLALPGLGNCWVSALKETALVSVTGLVEIMRQSHVAAGSSRHPFLFYTLAAVLFLGLTTFSGAGFRRLEKWAGRGERV